MTYDEFSQILKDLKLSKDEFSKIVGMSYNSVANWSKKEIPAWVDPFLFYYEKGKTLDELLAIIEKYKK